MRQVIVILLTRKCPDAMTIKTVWEHTQDRTEKNQTQNKVCGDIFVVVVQKNMIV